MEHGEAFSVFCTGFEDISSHVEYTFHVVHFQSGCAWKVRRRYSEILRVHEFLSGLAEKVPAFPPKGLQSWSLLMGESLPVQYFRELLSRSDMVAHPEFQSLLGVQRPPPVSTEVTYAKCCSLAEAGLWGLDNLARRYDHDPDASYRDPWEGHKNLIEED
eukprot:Skav219607  [mRNA]  locus=scaffold628:60806:66950:- [translate_table: standard]